MRKLWFLLFVFLLLAVTVCFAGAQEQPSRRDRQNTKNADSPYTWDFGKVNQGEVLHHVFVLRNKTGKTLNIKQVGTSCGCTVSKAAKKVLLPEESTEIEVAFKTKNYLGPVKQFVYVLTDDIDNSILKFTIKAEIIKQQ